MSRKADPGASLRLIEQCERRRGPRTHGGRWPASGARVRRADGSMSPEMSFAAAGREVARNGGQLVNVHTGETVSPEVAAKAAQLPMSSPEAHGAKE